MNNKQIENKIKKFINCKKDSNESNLKDSILELAKKEFSDGYNKYYTIAYSIKDEEIAEILIDEIIGKKPYFENPCVYLDKFHLLFRHKKHEQQQDKALKNYFISYEMNVKFEDIGNYSEEDILCSFFHATDEFAWEAIGFLKRLTEFHSQNKSWRSCDQDSMNAWRLLSEIYERYEGKESENRLRYIHLYELYFSLCMICQGVEEAEEYECEERLAKLIMKVNPEEPLAFYGLGRLCYEKGDIEKAKSFFEEAVNYFVEEWHAYYLLGEIYAHEKKYREAEKTFNQMFKFYDEDDIGMVVKKVKELLHPIGGGKIDYAKIVEHKGVVDLRNIEKSSNTFFDSLLGQDKDLIEKEADQNLCNIYGKYYNEFHDNTKKHLQQGETAYLSFEKSGQEIMLEAYMHYYDALMSEIFHKVFKTFRDNYYRCFQQGHGNNMKQLMFTKDYFYDFMNGRGFTPTGGQIIGILLNKNTDVVSNDIYKGLIKHIDLVAPILQNEEYIDRLKELKEERNKKAHSPEYGPSEAHYPFVRNCVVGTKKKEGMLLKFMESLGGK